MKQWFAVLTLLLLISETDGRDSWSHFRGNNLDGHARDNSYVLNFSEEQNIVWKTEIPGLGYSSPLVWENQVWVTTATRTGDKMSLLCLDYNTGKIIRDILLFEPDTIQRIHATNSYATSTPCLEEGFVYAHFGTYGTACIRSNDFTVVWKREDMKCEHMQGAASSLCLYGNLLIVHIEGTDFQYIAALDKSTGKTVWKAERPRELYKDIAPVYRKAYTTPLLVNVEGKDQLISNGAQVCCAYDPLTGKELWSFWYGHDSTVGMPLAYGGLVFFNSGWIFPENSARFVRFFAVDPRGTGDVTKSHLKWELAEDVPQISTPVIVEGKIYMVHERGDVTCVDALTGKIVWKDKLQGQFNASPIYAGGNIYFSEIRGTVYVVKPADHLQMTAVNKLEGTIKATPAFIDGNIILRTEKHLYRIGTR